MKENPKCDCGFEFETRPGEFRNFNIALGISGVTIIICPDCGTEWMNGFPKS